MNPNFAIELSDDAAQMIAGGSGDKKGKKPHYKSFADATAYADAYGKDVYAVTYTDAFTRPGYASAYSSSTASSK